MSGFDPYHVWLGIAADEQPADSYRLLGIRKFEGNPDVIANAAYRQMAHLKTFQIGARANECQRLLNEVSVAAACLLDPQRKAAYDASIQPAPFAPVVSPNISRNRPKSYPVASIVQVVLGGALGIFLAVLILNYFWGIDILGKAKKSEPIAARLEKPEAIDDKSETPSPRAKTNLSPRPSVMPQGAFPPGDAFPPGISPPGISPTTSVSGTRGVPNFGPEAASSIAPPATGNTSPITSTISSSPARSRDPLDGVPTACRLPSLITTSSVKLLSLARDPDDSFRVNIRSLAANLPESAAIFAEPGSRPRSWNISYVADLNARQGILPLAELRGEGSDLIFTWNAQGAIEQAKQLANCQLELRAAASACIVSLREPQTVGEVVLDLSTDKQDVDFPVADLPRPDRLRPEIKELVDFPTGTKMRRDLNSIELGKSTIIEFAELPGAEIGLRFFRPSATSNAVLRLEPIFKENAASKHDLTTEHLTEMETALTRTVKNAQSQLPGAQSDLKGAQSALRSLQGSRPSNFQQITAWQQQVTRADGQVTKAAGRVKLLQKQIVEGQSRLAAVPKIRTFLDDLHQRATIRYVVVAESGESDLLVVDGQRPKSPGN